MAPAVPGPAGPPPPWAPPPRRRRSRWLTVGLPTGALLLLGGCGTLAVLAVNAFAGAIELYGDPRLVRYEVTGIEVNSSGGRSTGQATITFATGTGLKDPTFLLLVEDGDAWRPCP